MAVKGVLPLAPTVFAMSAGTDLAWRRAVTALEAGRLNDAEDALREITPGALSGAATVQAMASLPGLPAARSLAVWAELRQRQLQFDEARSLYLAALELDPLHYGALCNLGILESEAGRTAQCEALLQRAIAADPARPNAYVNLGTAFEAARRHADAITLYQTALRHAPDHALIHFNLGSANFALGRLDAAIAAWRATIRCDAGFGEVYWNLAQALFLRGDFTPAWAALEQRWRSSQFAGFKPMFAQPQSQWQGEDLRGKRLLLWGEQGFGDQIQFARFATPAAARGAVVILAVRRELLDLCADIAGVAQCVDVDQDLPPFDVHCALLDLPQRLHTTATSIPPAPYLRASDALQPTWATRMPQPRRLRVGLVWSSGMSVHNRRLQDASVIRSFTLATYAPLWRQAADFFSLQVDARAEETGTPVIDWSGDLHSFADTAALMSHLDLVISVDTAAAHLAGALGIPVWILLRRPADWRWGEGAAASPTASRWYASARLFRQTNAGDWSAAVAEAADALAGLIAARPQA